MQRRKLLLLSYHFPPSSEVAGKPTARLVRYLPALGWEPTVLTIPASDPRVTVDEKAYADVVARTRYERVARGFHPRDVAIGAARARGWVKRLFRGSGEELLDELPISPGGLVERRSWLKRAVYDVLGFPDVQAGWVLPALRRALKLTRNEHYDAMMTVSPTFSTQIVGLLVHRWRGLPWIAQFHDPWADNPFHVATLKSVDTWTEWLERQLVRTADRVVMVTEEAEQAIRARHAGAPDARFAVLHNGYDPVDFPAIESERREGPGAMRLTYTGSLYGSRTPYGLMEGVAQLASQGAIREGDLTIRLIGDCSHSKGRPVMEVARELGIERFVSVERSMPYADALRALSQSDVLLLFAQQQPQQVPAKLYEYFHLNKKILAFADGATARMVRETGAGQVVESCAAEDMARMLMDLLRLHRSGHLGDAGVAPDDLEQYQSKNLATSLAQMLDGIAGTAAETATEAGIEMGSEQRLVATTHKSDVSAKQFA